MGEMLDFSTGDPLLPMTALANHAFRRASKDLAHYQVLQANGFNKAIVGILKDMSGFFTRGKIYDPNYLDLGPSQMLPTGGGTSAAFDLTLRLLAEDFAKRTEIKT